MCRYPKPNLVSPNVPVQSISLVTVKAAVTLAAQLGTDLDIVNI